MNNNFPAVLTTRSIEEQICKIEEEINEYRAACENESRENQDKEAVDILHAVETFLRLRFKNRDDELDEIIHKVFVKNQARGYYTKKCH